MFVCICRAVPLSRVRAVIDAGARSVDEVEAACGAGGECGSCRKEIEGIIIERSEARCGECPGTSRDRRASRAA